MRSASTQDARTPTALDGGRPEAAWCDVCSCRWTPTLPKLTI